MVESGTPYRLDPDQVLRAATALLKAIERSKKEINTGKSTKPDLFDADGEGEVDANSTPVWLVFTAKNHVLDSNRLKPGKIKVPHPLLTTKESRICLITADPPTSQPKAYKELLESPLFPADLKSRIAKVYSISKLKSKYKSYETKRQLLAEYDLFLADDRIITGLPMVLGKIFYKSTSKRPVPVSLIGNLKNHGQGRPDKAAANVKKRRDKESGGSTNIGRPAEVGAEIEKTLETTLVHLAPAATTSVKAALTSWTPDQVAANVQAIVDGMVDRFIPKKWRGVKSIHIKTPTSAALPIWLADELWADEEQVLNVEQTPESTFNKSKKRKAVEGEKSDQPVKTKKTKALKPAKKAVAV